MYKELSEPVKNGTSAMDEIRTVKSVKRANTCMYNAILHIDLFDLIMYEELLIFLSEPVKNGHLQVTCNGRNTHSKKCV